MSSVNATSGTGIDAIAQQLMKAFDRNQDGQLTTAEFTAVLNGMLGNLPSTTSAAASSSPAATGGTTHQLAGFNLSKLDTSQSIKYKFGRAAMGFSVDSVKDKASAEALLNQMKPAMEREGLEVLEISKDKIRVNYEGQPLWVDVIQGASTGATAFQWLPE